MSEKTDFWNKTENPFPRLPSSQTLTIPNYVDDKNRWYFHPPSHLLSPSQHLLIVKLPNKSILFPYVDEILSLQKYNHHDPPQQFRVHQILTQNKPHSVTSLIEVFQINKTNITQTKPLLRWLDRDS